jgi:MFS family permease
VFVAVAYGSGYVVNFADIVPAYSSIIFSVAGTIGTLGALISNVVAGVVIKQPILHDWRKLFVLFTIYHFFGGFVYLFYGSAVPRKWATFKPEKSEYSTARNEMEAVEMLQTKQLTDQSLEEKVENTDLC